MRLKNNITLKDALHVNDLLDSADKIQKEIGVLQANASDNLNLLKKYNSNTWWLCVSSIFGWWKQVHKEIEDNLHTQDARIAEVSAIMNNVEMYMEEEV